MIDFPRSDTELQRWPRWASASASTLVVARSVAGVALTACLPDYALLRPVLLELKRRYPEG